ncbi:hypothetical protein CHARACLAT_017818 [Characodon lateralis]|uniref:Uncharacterized protein n=1 Tax=Characodon lateralis TaxID=208331 RepID=A0ABU7EDS6_9TELE|nr:hypothetical protein [Characodon lateralis]
MRFSAKVSKNGREHVTSLSWVGAVFHTFINVLRGPRSQNKVRGSYFHHKCSESESRGLLSGMLGYGAEFQFWQWITRRTRGAVQYSRCELGDVMNLQLRWCCRGRGWRVGGCWVLDFEKVS